MQKLFPVGSKRDYLPSPNTCVALISAYVRSLNKCIRAYVSDCICMSLHRSVCLYMCFSLCSSTDSVDSAISSDVGDMGLCTAQQCCVEGIMYFAFVEFCHHSFPVYLTSLPKTKF